MRPVSILFTFFIIMLEGCEPAPPSIWTYDGDVRYHPGDDLRWAKPGWNDENWLQTPALALPDSIGQLWVRFETSVPEVETLGMSVAAVVAREVYWDGYFVGRAGRVGVNKADEHAGPIDAKFRIPDSLAAPGIHTVAVRLSTFRRPAGASGLLMEFVIGDFATLVASPFRSIGLPILFLGGFVLVALYYGILFFADRRRLPYLLTAVLCLVVAALLVAESWRNAIGYSYTLHTVRLGIIESLTALVGVLLSTTFAIQFNLPPRWTVLSSLAAAIGLALILINDHETATYTVFTISLVVALAIVGWASLRKRPGALLALLGVAFCFVALLFAGHDFMDDAFFPAFGVLVAGLLTSVGLQTREERRLHAIARATASRLEAELLKKHLQPHFLMNTLTSVIEWVETDPAQGARAIEALTAELRTLTDVSGERLISMAQEIALCKAHLEVMGFRQAVKFELDVEGVDPNGMIPPAIIHTLVENGVTHNAYSSGQVKFVLRENRTDTRRHLVLQTPLAGERKKTQVEGGGLKYVRARLEEVAPGKWHLSSRQENDMWITRIELPVGGLE